jgi:type II secretory pathway component PulF
LGGIYYSIYFRDYLKTPEGKFKWDRWRISMPGFGMLNRKLLIAHFCRALGVLLATGIPMLRAMDILIEFMDNDYFREVVLRRVYNEIKEGRSVTNAIQETGFFPLMVSNMIAVGENTGEMPQMLAKISAFYDSEIVYALEAFLSLIEPVLIIFMGLITCFVLLSVFLPLYSFIMNMGK